MSADEEPDSIGPVRHVNGHGWDELTQSHAPGGSETGGQVSIGTLGRGHQEVLSLNRGSFVFFCWSIFPSSVKHARCGPTMPPTCQLLCASGGVLWPTCLPANTVSACRTQELLVGASPLPSGKTPQGTFGVAQCVTACGPRVRSLHQDVEQQKCRGRSCAEFNDAGPRILLLC